MPCASQVSTQELVKGSPDLNTLCWGISTEPTPIHMTIFGTPGWAEKQMQDKNRYWEVYLTRKHGAVVDLQPAP